MLKFHPRIAPIKAAVFPLVKRDGMPERAEAIYRELKRHHNVAYDEKGAIGRRYRRQDEAGTPFCITVDSQTLTDDTVTFRDRDTCRQWRVPSAGVSAALVDLLEGRGCAGGQPLNIGILEERIVGFWIDTMKPCISQATTLKTPFEADPAVFSRNGWTDVEIWLTKLETFLQDHSLAEARTTLASEGIRPVAAASQGGLLLSRGGERESHWKHFAHRLAILAELEVPVLIVTPDFVPQAERPRLPSRRRVAWVKRRNWRRPSACALPSNSRRPRRSAPVSKRRWP